VGTTEQPPRFEPLTCGKLPRLDSNQEPAG
jgi:hypothetical protein